MSAKSTWNDGWEAGHTDTLKAFEATASDPRDLNYEPADQRVPDADPGFDRAAWEDGYMIGSHYANEAIPAFARTANPHA
ncbi:hypothetical protein [Curtobacterium sp. MCPF17_001]|uniref:hypothetical protein n=1 Tax=Curtobacterium sp. MCPF17_001 TaxID=2175651 RepID=UPI0011B3874E|nr:hypothetical protein [Curtobacterium sp. MCPF17_001]